MNNFKLLSLAALLWLPTMLTNAKVRLPHLLSDGMIVQQNADVRLWGWDKPGTTVRVTTSWSDETAETQTGKNGECYFQSVTCYSSKDLVNWKFENDVLTGKTKNIGMVTWFGRLGAAYCPKSRKYIICAQYNGSVLFAQCDTPTGNFEIGNVQEQIPGVVNTGTGDQTLFVDDDGQAYLICSSAKGRSHQYVCKLRESDFLAAERAVGVKKGSGREGNCMFKYKNKYYFCASDLHGWNASHSYYMVADNINGPYSDWKVMDGTDNDFSRIRSNGLVHMVIADYSECRLQAILTDTGGVDDEQRFVDLGSWK